MTSNLRVLLVEFGVMGGVEDSDRGYFICFVPLYVPRFLLSYLILNNV